MKVEYYKKSW